MAENTQDTEETEEATADEAAEATPAERSAAEPWSWIPDWFEQWPPAFARRMPELMSQIGLPEAIKVEEHVDGDTLVIRAEIPGVDPEEHIDVSVSGGKLTISAHREQREETKDDKSFHSEFRYGSFRRTLPVPEGTDPDDVQATYEDGILEVRLPTAAETAPRRKVQINRP